MYRRQLLGNSGLSLLFLSGCVNLRPSDEDSRWNANFTVLEYSCVEEDDSENSNRAEIDEESSELSLRGTISDGEAQRTAELGDISLDDTILYITIKTVSDESISHSCPLKIDYSAEFVLEESSQQIDAVVIQHNGKRVET
ncbi:hypothetical protein ACNS7O_17365 (plasmid) [Haloferacaceae archaeon DSL9]